MDKSIKILIKIGGYTTVLVVYLLVLFRGLLPYLLGSRLDLVVFATPFVGIIGVILFVVISYKFSQDIIDTK